MATFYHVFIVHVTTASIKWGGWTFDAANRVVEFGGDRRFRYNFSIRNPQSLLEHIVRKPWCDSVDIADLYSLLAEVGA